MGLELAVTVPGTTAKLRNTLSTQLLTVPRSSCSRPQFFLVSIEEVLAFYHTYHRCLGRLRGITY